MRFADDLASAEHGGRTIRVGETYRAKSRPGVDPARQRTRTIVRFAPRRYGPDAEMLVRSPAGVETWMTLGSFFRWAGERVGDGP